MTDNFTELAFTESVKAQQEKYGSRAAYSRMEQGGEFRNKLTWQERGFIEARDSFYMSSVGDNGWPYMQFRGGPKGFLKALDDNTLATGILPMKAKPTATKSQWLFWGQDPGGRKSSASRITRQMLFLKKSKVPLPECLVDARMYSARPMAQRPAG